MILLAADLAREHGLPVDENQELVGPIVPFDAEEALLDADEESARQDVFRVRREVVMDHRAAARAERQPFEMTVLGQVERDMVRGRRRDGVRVANSHVRDAERDG